MKRTILFWGNKYDLDLKKHLDAELADGVTVLDARSYLDVIHLLETSKYEIDFVLTLVDLSDIESLYQTQKLQKKYRDLPLLALFDTDGESKLIENMGKVVAMLHCQHSQSKELSSKVSALPVKKQKHKQECKMDTDYSLTKRQLEVLSLLVDGKSNKQIARDLHLSEGTIKIHCMAIYREIGVSNRTQAAIRAESLFRSEVSSF